MRRYAFVLSLLLATLSITAQIKSLSDIETNKTYLIKNCNGFGYCIYNPERAEYYGTNTWYGENYLTLGEATSIHSAGLANDAFKEVIDPKNTNNQWYIQKQSNGKYYLKNVGQKKYATNEFGISWGTSVYYMADESWMLSSDPFPIVITEVREGVFAFQTVSGLTKESDLPNRYMCAATQKANSIANWQITDLGSEWQILKPEDYITNSNTGDDNGGNNDHSGDNDEEEDLGPISYFTLNDGQMIAIPHKYLLSRTEKDGKLTLNLLGDTTFVISKNSLASEETEYNGVLPVYESFKFNNKFNDQLFDDADGVIDNEQNTITFDFACIDRRLTPSFKLSEENSDATTWVNGVQQHSKKTSQRFVSDITYTLAKPKNWIYKVIKVSDAVYSNPDTDNSDSQWIITPLNLTASMLSTNWPSINESDDLANVLDDNINTYFHSNWSATNDWKEGAYYGDGTTTWPYIQIDPAEELSSIQFEYTTRNSSSNNGYAPQGLIVQVSADGQTWTDVQSLTAEKDNLPVGQAVSYTSPVINLGGKYSHLRLQLTASTRKNYFVLSKLKVSKVEDNPDYNPGNTGELITPAVYEKKFVPFGRNYKVKVNNRTANPTSQYNVPTIYINTADGRSITSKTVYSEASFTLDGAGIWEDINIENMLIRGRGNTSWGGGYTKEPYRLKFAEKIKPFGLKSGKNWVLLANKQTGSMTTNAIAMKLADMVKTEGCNHIVPVELYINGEYRGSYNFTEKVGFSNNSIDLEDETVAAMLELDSYEDEVYMFKDNFYSMNVKVAQPDFAESDPLRQVTYTSVKNSFNQLVYNLGIAGGEVYANESIDVEAFVRAWFVNDFTRNQECKHPKSWYLYSESIPDKEPWKFGPVWDFDWAYGYDGPHNYFINSAEMDIFQGMTTSNLGYPFFKALVNNSDIVKKAYYRLWTEFLTSGGLDALMEWCDDYHQFAGPSLIHNASRWSSDGKQYETVRSNAKNWLTKRANYIYSKLQKYDLEDDEDEPDVDYGQPTHINLSEVTDKPVDVYTIGGVRLRTQVPFINATQGLMPGIYIVGGQKIVVR